MKVFIAEYQDFLVSNGITLGVYSTMDLATARIESWCRCEAMLDTEAEFGGNAHASLIEKATREMIAECAVQEWEVDHQGEGG
jgi:hypothetical protein